MVVGQISWLDKENFLDTRNMTKILALTVMVGTFYFVKQTISCLIQNETRNVSRLIVHIVL